MKRVTIFLILVLVTATAYSQARVNKIMNGNYIIISALNEKVLDVNGAGTNNGANIGVWEYNGQSNQLFKVQFDNEGLTFITCVNSNKVVSIEYDSKNDMANVNQWENYNGGGQKYYIEPVPNSDLFMIVNKNSEKVLTVEPVSGNVVILSRPDLNEAKNLRNNRYWRFAQRIMLKGYNSGKVIDIPNGTIEFGTKVIIYKDNETPNQGFDMIPIVNQNKYFIRSIKSLAYLTVDNGIFTNGNYIVQDAFRGNETQQFKMEEIKQYTYRITTNNNFYLMPEQNKYDNGTKVVITNNINNETGWVLNGYKNKLTKNEKKEVKEEIKKEVKEEIKDLGNKTKNKIKKFFK